MGLVFAFTMLTMILVSLIDSKGQSHENDIIEDATRYKLSNANLAMIFIVLGLVAAMYIRFW